MWLIDWGDWSNICVINVYLVNYITIWWVGFHHITIFIVVPDYHLVFLVFCEISFIIDATKQKLLEHGISTVCVSVDTANHGNFSNLQDGTPNNPVASTRWHAQTNLAPRSARWHARTILLRACPVYKSGSLPESSRTNPTPDNFVFHTIV